MTLQSRLHTQGVGQDKLDLMGRERKVAGERKKDGGGWGENKKLAGWV